MNKQNIWFLTLFSLILVLSVYYITMPSDIFLNNGRNPQTETTPTGANQDGTQVTINESGTLTAMRLSLEEDRLELSNDLRSQLTSDETTMDEKNSAYDKLRALADLSSMEQKLEKKIKDNFNIESFVKIDNGTIKVVAVSEKHDTALANSIMRSIQEEYQDRMYITVQFENK